VLAQYSDKENHPVDDNKVSGPTNGRSASPGGFFRKRNTMRSKSLGKDNWDSAFFGERLQGNVVGDVLSIELGSFYILFIYLMDLNRRFVLVCS